MLACWWCFSCPEFVTPICIGFCMVLSLVEILFSGEILLFSSPPTQSLFKFALVWLLGKAQGGLCIRLLVSSVACASSSSVGD
jgi:hypothetical protein